MSRNEKLLIGAWVFLLVIIFFLSVLVARAYGGQNLILDPTAYPSFLVVVWDHSDPPKYDSRWYGSSFYSYITGFGWVYSEDTERVNNPELVEELERFRVEYEKLYPGLPEWIKP